MFARILIAFAATCLAIGLTTPGWAQAIPGVSDEETTIAYAGEDGIREYHFGGGDSLYVRDRRGDWYRVGLNEGCLSGMGGLNGETMIFRVGSDQRLDTFSRVYFEQARRNCGVRSIRRSVAPPQVDSQSPIPLG